jgi:hypothetical protein
MLAESNHAVAKSLFLGGVTRRFPELNFAFLEGGVAWAVTLFADIIGHWEKRNGPQMRALDPAKSDWQKIRAYFEKYQPEWADLAPTGGGYAPRDAEMLDEFAACGIERAEDIRQLFVSRYFFGCEADDPTTSIAFDTKATPFGARFNAMFGSDISHWDVPDMSEVLEEALEMVDHGQITEADFRDFVFANPIAFYTRANPSFFAGTRVEDAVSAHLRAPG